MRSESLVSLFVFGVAIGDDAAAAFEVPLTISIAIAQATERLSQPGSPARGRNRATSHFKARTAVAQPDGAGARKSAAFPDRLARIAPCPQL